MSKNLPASVRQRLANKAQETGRPFQEVLQYFAMERFLYRLSRSPHADKFVLKGALMFTAWGGLSSRPTKDIDLLARMDNTVEAVETVMREVCGQEVEADGLVFDTESVAGEAIKEDADYPGVRVTFLVTLLNGRLSMQIDMGFGDVVTPSAAMTGYPALLDFPAPLMLGYPRETVVAEKFEAMTKLGLLNSRMKDFYDLWVLCQQFDFDGVTLATAIRRTFTHRKTAVVAHRLHFQPSLDRSWPVVNQLSRIWDRTHNRSVEDCDIAPTGTVVHLENYGMVKVFRIISKDGTAEH